jgi:L-aspartate oxidase
VSDTYSYIVIGSGIAGLFTALQAREHGPVLLLTKSTLEDNNSRWAQGGIAAAVGPDDSPEEHQEDTLQAGAGLCDPEAVRVLVTEGPHRIADLIRLGVVFDTIHGEIALAREGGHRRARVLHAGGDATGAVIEWSLPTGWCGVPWGRGVKTTPRPVGRSSSAWSPGRSPAPTFLPSP